MAVTAQVAMEQEGPVEEEALLGQLNLIYSPT